MPQYRDIRSRTCCEFSEYLVLLNFASFFFKFCSLLHICDPSRVHSAFLVCVNWGLFYTFPKIHRKPVFTALMKNRSQSYRLSSLQQCWNKTDAWHTPCCSPMHTAKTFKFLSRREKIKWRVSFPFSMSMSLHLNEFHIKALVLMASIAPTISIWGKMCGNKRGHWGGGCS